MAGRNSPRPSTRMDGERSGKNRDTGSSDEKRTASTATRRNGTPDGTGRRNEISGGQSDADAVYHRDIKKNAPPLYTKGGEGSGTVSGQADRTMSVFPFPSLSVSLHASSNIASACLTADVALPPRSRFPFGRYERRSGGPFPVPSPRPVFRCPACPTRRPSRPCPAWRRRCPGACGNRLRGRSLGRRAGRQCRPR